jgi:hypothetical protein
MLIACSDRSEVGALAGRFANSTTLIVSSNAGPINFRSPKSLPQSSARPAPLPRPRFPGTMSVVT